MAIFNTGDKVHRFTILNLDHKDSKFRKFYKVKCDCGNEKIVNGGLIKSGNTKSCGCLAKETPKTKLPDNGGVINQILLQYQRHAKGRNIAWNLSKELFTSIITKSCFYCGITAGNIKKTKNCKEGFPYNGIDRMDPEGIYEESNVVPCCGVCNLSKQSMTRETFLSWIKRVYKHSIN